MKVCPKCKAENLFEGAQFCRECGSPLDEEPEKNVQTDQSDDNLDFVVTETPDSDPPNLAGMQEEKPVEKEKFEEAGGSDDDLEITNTPDLLANSDVDLPLENQKQPEYDFNIEQDTVPEIASNDQTNDDSGNKNHEANEPVGIDWDKDAEKASKVNERISELNNYAEEKEDKKESKIPFNSEYAPIDPSKIPPKPPESRDIEQEKSTVTQIDDPALNNEPKIQRSQKARGIAYYRNNIIQLAGKPFLHENDEIVVNEKPYLLKPKKIDKRLIYGLVAAAVLVVMIGVVSLLVQGGIGGEGEIVGMVLDEYTQPYLEGAVVSIPSLGKKTRTNAQGFFHFEGVPTGTYKIVYQVSGDVYGEGNATVTGGHLTMASFSEWYYGDYAQKKNETAEQPVAGRPSAQPIAAKPDNSSNDSKSNKTPPKKSSSKTSSNKSSNTSANTQAYGKIKLNANVDNAKIAVDGNVLGLGNNTYSKISTGTHTVIVSKPGYKDFKETVKLAKNDTHILHANLSRSERTEKMTVEDYISRGRDAIRQNALRLAIDDFSRAIDKSPGNLDAYIERAEAYSAAGEDAKAAGDYVRIGEICRFNKDIDKSIDAFTKALKINDESAVAYIGRAGARLDKSEYRSALKDYESALDIDKYSYPALLGAGSCEYRLGDYKHAEKYFERAYKVNKKDPYLYQYLMLTYLARDDISEMRETYSEFKTIANPAELASFKSSSRYEPIMRLIKEENR